MKTANQAHSVQYFEPVVHVDPKKVAARAFLQSLGVDGSVAADKLTKVAKIPAGVMSAANDNIAPPVVLKAKSDPARNPIKGSPTRERLTRAGDAESVFWLKRFRSVAALNDETGYADGGSDDDEENKAPELSIERNFEIRPSINEMKRATNPTDWGMPENKPLDSLEFENGVSGRKGETIIRLDGMRFRNGPQEGRKPPLHSYKNGAGLWRAPSEKLRRPKGTPIADNDNTPAFSSNAAFDFNCEIERRHERDRIHSELGDNWQVLEMANGAYTAKEIGGVLGKSGKNAENFGIRAIKEAIKCFKKSFERVT